MDCVFCKIVRKEIPCEPLLETDELLAFKDINPVAPFHVLVIPKRHISTLNDIEEEDERLLGRMALAAAALAGKGGFAESGYRLVINCNRDGGQEVFHIHMHVLAGRRIGPLAAGE